MKRIAFAVVLAAAALAASSARADTRVSVGINVGTPVYRPSPPAVVVAPAPVVVAPSHSYGPPPAVVYQSPTRGYWKDVTVKTWVPERWVMSRNRWGHSVRVCEPGYFAYRTERVWVDGRHDNGHHYGHDNRYSYDNRNDRSGWNR
jgi:hypothetical protein